MTGKPLELRPDAKERLVGYEWPGNVRELKNVIDRGAAMSDRYFRIPDDFGQSVDLDGAEEALVVLAHGAQPVVALAPRSILVHRVAAERRQQTVEVVPVLVPHVLFDGGHPQAVAS